MVITDYEKATKTEITDEIVEEYKAKKLLELTDNKKKTFYDARKVAFDEFNAQKALEFNALASLWQTYEDNDFTVE